MKQIIYVETLRFANQTLPIDEYLRKHPNSRAKDWKKKPMTREEVDALLSTILVIGILGYPIV